MASSNDQAMFHDLVIKMRPGPTRKMIKYGNAAPRASHAVLNVHDVPEMQETTTERRQQNKWGNTQLVYRIQPRLTNRTFWAS
jgi:hypothetical protein